MSIVEVLKSAGQKDLEEIRTRIEELQKELATLKVAERVIDTRLNGAKPKQPKGAKSNKVAEAAYEVIAKYGAGSASAIASKLGDVYTAHQVAVAMAKSGWFSKDPDTGKWGIKTTKG